MEFAFWIRGFQQAAWSRLGERNVNQEVENGSTKEPILSIFLLRQVLGHIRNGYYPPDIRIRPSLTNSSRIVFSCEYRIDAFARNRLRSILPPCSVSIQRTRSRGYCELPTNVAP